MNAPPRSIDGAAGLDRARDLERLLARLDRARTGDQAERLAAADRRPAISNRRLVVAELATTRACRAARSARRGRPRHALEPELGDALGIADRADRRRQLAGHHDDVDAGRLEARADGLDLGLGAWGVITIITARPKPRLADDRELRAGADAVPPAPVADTITRWRPRRSALRPIRPLKGTSCAPREVRSRQRAVRLVAGAALGMPQPRGLLHAAPAARAAPRRGAGRSASRWPPRPT